MTRIDDLDEQSAVEPTGWARVDRNVTEVRKRLETATTEEQFQAVGLLCRETLISLGQAVYDDAQLHSPPDGVPPSNTDAKRMLDAYFSAAFSGSAHKYARKHMRAACDLAVHFQHRRTASFREAAACAEATTSLVNLIAIMAGLRDPTRESNPPTLESLFKSDFADLLCTEQDFEVIVHNQHLNLNETVNVKVKLCRDFRSNTDFLSVYIPKFHNAFLYDNTNEMIKTLRDEVDTLRGNLGSVVVGLKAPGGGYNESTGLAFSGRVFVYSTNQLTPGHIGELVKWYRERGMHLDIRGTDYWLFHPEKVKWESRR